MNFVTCYYFSSDGRVTVEKNDSKGEKHALSGWQSLIVSTATRVGMGNLAGVVAAISAGGFGVVFIAITLWLFSFSTFVGVLFYARSNISYIFGDKMYAQTIYKIIALAMLFIGGLAAYEVVWTIGDIGIALMTVLNAIAIIPMGSEAFEILKKYQLKRKNAKNK